MGLFGNQGSTKSSSSSTIDSTISGDQRQAVQTGSAYNVGSGVNSTSAVGGALLATGKGRITINNDLSAGVLHDSLAAIDNVVNASLSAVDSQSSRLAGLAGSQQQGVLSAVTGKSVGPDASRYVTPLVLGALALAALLLFKGKM